MLEGIGKTLQMYGSPIPQHNWHPLNTLIGRELAYNALDKAIQEAEKLAQLNADQRSCFQTIIRVINSSHSEKLYFFIQGPAGTGKTFLYNLLCHYYRAKEKIVLCVTFSGTVSLLLPGGRTSHSRFKIPLNIHENSSCCLSKNSELADLLREVTLFIWDEVPMQHRYCFQAVNKLLKDMRSDERLFGGLLVVMSGDFAQILSVVRRGT